VAAQTWPKPSRIEETAAMKAAAATIGFQQAAKLDDGDFWPTSYAVTGLTAPDQKKLLALLKKATS
jgi:hypothetical protein